MDSTRGDDAAEIVQMAMNGLEYYTSLSDKAAAGFERTDSSFQRSPTVREMLSNSVTCCRESVREKKIHLARHTSASFYLCILHWGLSLPFVSIMSS